MGRVLRDIAAATSAALGPLTAAVATYTQQRREVAGALSANSAGAMAPLYRSKLEHKLQQLTKKLSTAADAQEKGMRKYIEVTQQLASMASPEIAAITSKYVARMEAINAGEAGVLDAITERVEKLVNSDRFSVAVHGDTVQVKHEGRLATARVERPQDGRADLVLWHQVEFSQHEYEEGFDTMHTRPVFTRGGVVHPHHRLQYQMSKVERHCIYKETHPLQEMRQRPPLAGGHAMGGPASSFALSSLSAPMLSRTHRTSTSTSTSTRRTTSGPRSALPPRRKKSSLVGGVGGDDAPAKDYAGGGDGGGAHGSGGSATGAKTATLLEQFLWLFGHAELSLPRAQEIAYDILLDVKEHGEPETVLRIATMKGISRGWTKVLMKYSGQVNKLTDIVRMTYTCTSLAGVLQVVNSIAADPRIEIKRIKNRLMLEYRPDSNGGYRDLLINVALVDTGHIVEIQVTLESLLTLRTGGGHALYTLARVLNLLEATVNWHVGQVGEAAIQAMGVGVLKGMECEGTEIKYAEQFHQLVRALALPTCVLTTLNLASTVGHLEGKALAEIISPAIAVQLANTLTALDLGSNSLIGQVPATLSKLTRLIKLNLGRNELSGAASAIGNLPVLQWLLLGKNNLSGSIADIINGCLKLRVLVLESNRFNGEIPTSIGQLDQLRAFVVDSNNLSGKIPVEIEGCIQLRSFSAAYNNIEGSLDPLVPLTTRKLEAVSVERNILQGRLPRAMFQKGSTLHYLNLEDNKLNGCIPDTIGVAVLMQKVWLGGNAFSGTLPPTLADCKQLVSFGAERNALEGGFPLNVIKSCNLLAELVLFGNVALEFSEKVLKAFDDAHLELLKL